MVGNIGEFTNYSTVLLLIKSRIPNDLATAPSLCPRSDGYLVQRNEFTQTPAVPYNLATAHSLFPRLYGFFKYASPTTLKYTVTTTRKRVTK